MSPTVEVEMRPAEVFVRELSPEEGNRLKSISRRARYQAKRQRAMIVLASATGMPAPQIAEVVRSDPSQVRRVIHEFNERGSTRSTLTTGAGALRRRRPPSAIGSCRSRAPAPTAGAFR
jgi:Winged helix-turn helix